MDGHITTGPVALIADQNLFSFTRGDFKVYAHGNGLSYPTGEKGTGVSVPVDGLHGRLAYIVRGKAFTLRNRMLVMDPFGNKLALLEKHLMSLRHEYRVYTYYPNQIGMESKEVDDEGMTVYRFAQIEKALLAMTDEYYYSQ